MNETEQVKNIIAFLAILFGECDCWHDIIMNYTPEYLIEKFNRYIESTRPESEWGLHPSLRRRVFNTYCDKWKLSRMEYHEIGE